MGEMNCLASEQELGGRGGSFLLDRGTGEAMELSGSCHISDSINLAHTVDPALVIP